MRSLALRSAAALLCVAAAAGTSAVMANASSARPGSKGCTSRTQGVAGENAAQTLKTVSTNIPKACGFEISGFLLGADYGIDGVQLLGKTTFGPGGNVHLVFVDQGIVLDVYRIGGNEYVRLYEDGKPTAKPDLNLTTMWHGYGVGNSVIKAAGSVKWVRLTAAQRKLFNGPASYPSTIGVLESPAGFAAALVKGTGEAWTLSGTKTIDGVSYTVLADPADANGNYPAETLYVNTATGLPAKVGYASQDGSSITTKFAAWSRTTPISAPRQVVAG
jgi:hypothetical protein